MESHDDLTAADLAIWQPWSRQLIALIDEVRSVVASEIPDSAKRVRLQQLGGDAHSLLERLGAQPDLPGAVGRAMRVLRTPAEVEPVHIADAIDRLNALAHLTCSATATTRDERPVRPRHRQRAVSDQQELPGLEPLTKGAPT